MNETLVRDYVLALGELRTARHRLAQFDAERKAYALAYGRQMEAEQRHETLLFDLARAEVRHEYLRGQAFGLGMEKVKNEHVSNSKQNANDRVADGVQNPDKPEGVV